MAIYLDYAATTPVDPKVLEAMLPYFSEKFGNADSRHSLGLKSKEAIDNSRRSIAKILNCKSSEIIFTSGGTEANNIAILGFVRANRDRGKHLITSAIEHSSVLEVFKILEKEGFEVTYLKPDPEGLISAEDLKNAIREDTIFASIMFANNEIGVVQDIAEFGRICREKGVVFHCDACQAAGAFELDVQKLNVDLMSLNAGKIYGPKGAGLLFVKNTLKLLPLTGGGGQEKNLRSGTQNTPGIVGMARALELAEENREMECARLTKLRDQLLKSLLKKIPEARLNGHETKRLPNNINLSISGIEGPELVLQLDAHDIYISIGSACATDSPEVSHVIKSLGVPDALAQGTIRLSLGKESTPEQIETVSKILPEIVNQLKTR